jgi:uncharacterized membrane protein
VTPRSKRAVAAVIVSAAVGVLFAAISTSDFVAHLDRQVHAITCAFIPGLAAPDTTGTSGCHAALMSPYSSVLGRTTWGGVPISLLALAVFAFIACHAVTLMLRGAAADRSETGFLLAATALPLLVSAAYFLLSLLRLGTLCKVCVGIYVASIAAFLAALAAHARAAAAAGPTPWERWTFYVVEGVAFVLIPTAAYLALKPTYPASLVGCGELLHPADRYGVRVRLTDGPVPAIEVLDPLCPACKALSLRLAATGLDRTLGVDASLFPLDRECNWMVSESVHPGACAASEAVLCAGPAANAVLAYLFAHQGELRELGRGGERPVAERLTAQYPALAGCLGTAAVRTRLNRSLRWAVSNSLPVLTPQLFIRNTKVCDEDMDLGLAFVAPRLVASVATPAPRRVHGGGR